MGAFKLGKMTFGSLFKKPETVLYPFEAKPKPQGLKGHISIDVSACILCGMCDKSCSTDCISVSKPERYWQIDRYACVQCGYCVTVCPKKCLQMLPEYAAASTTRQAERYIIPEQQKDAGKKVEAAKPQAGEVAPAPKKDQPIAQQQQRQPEPAEAEKADAQLEEALKLLDDEKIAKVRAALG